LGLCGRYYQDALTAAGVATNEQAISAANAGLARYFLRMDLDKNKLLTRAEMSAGDANDIWAPFDIADKNHDGGLDGQE
jgi:hypothetical protein